MTRNYQGHGTKSKHSTVNRPQESYKNQIPVPVSVPEVNKIFHFSC